MILPRRAPRELAETRQQAPPDEIVRRAGEIVQEVRRRGLEAVADCSVRFDGRDPQAPLIFDRSTLEANLAEAPVETRRRLERIAGRIRRFAEAQRRTLVDVEVEIGSFRAGQRFAPVERAGCYAPGGRYPLPSSALMTATTARVAGVGTVWLASPNPAPVTLCAAAVAGADGLLAAGGAQAIAALAFGAEPVPASDVVVGPGNQWVTAAKQLVAGRVAIDLPAGPSEVVVIADRTSDAATVAADLLAQAEHDPQALVVLLTVDGPILDEVEEELHRQLADLPTAETARRALGRGAAVLCADRDEVVRISDALAPEHLQVSIADPEPLAERLRHYGALFLGTGAGTVFGDYGAGPNHVLPTGGAARYAGGLSVLDFLRCRTWLGDGGSEIDPRLVDDSEWLARQEGLEAHARAAARRRRQ